jgi:hypothetical protein
MKRNIIAVVLTCAAIGAVIVEGGRPVAAQTAPCTPSGGLTFICGVQNAEDLVLVPNTRWLIASGMAPARPLRAWTRRSTQTVRVRSIRSRRSCMA